MIYAYTQNGIAKEVVRVDPFSIFQAAYASQFVECPDEVEAGWTLDGATWTPHIDWHGLVETPQPVHNPVTQRVMQITPELTVLGTWEQRWEVIELFSTQGERDAAIAANLATIRASKITAIKAERDRRKFNGVYVSGKWVHSDTYSRTQWMGMVMMGAGIPAIEWTTMDNTSITTSQSLASAVFAATATLDTTLFASAKSLIAAVDASDNPADVDIATGWPATFEGA